MRFLIAILCLLVPSFVFAQARVLPSFKGKMMIPGVNVYKHLNPANYRGPRIVILAESLPPFQGYYHPRLSPRAQRQYYFNDLRRLGYQVKLIHGQIVILPPAYPRVPGRFC